MEAKYHQSRILTKLSIGKYGQYEKEIHCRKRTPDTNGDGLCLVDRYLRNLPVSDAQDRGISSGVWRHDESSPARPVKPRISSTGRPHT